MLIAGEVAGRCASANNTALRDRIRRQRVPIAAAAAAIATSATATAAAIAVTTSATVATAATTRASPTNRWPNPALIDTDLSFDVDDVGAVCIAHALADRGEVDLLGLIFDSGYPEGVGALDALNHYYGRPDVLLGSYKGVFGRDVSGAYVPTLARTFPNTVKHYNQTLDAAAAYRRMLVNAADHSVVIAAIGFMPALRDLLASSPDEISLLDGISLVRQKVRKVVFQGGWYAPLHPNGHSTFNWDCGGAGAAWSPYKTDGCLGAAQYVVHHMPDTVQMVFSDIGDEVYHGGRLIRGSMYGCPAGTADNPCQAAYKLHPWGINYAGRQSWDPLVVLAAVRGSGGGQHLGGGHWIPQSIDSRRRQLLDKAESGRIRRGAPVAARPRR